MTYIRNKPDSGVSPFLDVPTIQGNFSAFNTAFNSNHVAMNAFSQGDHLNMIFEAQANFPETVVNSATLFSKNAANKAGPAQPQLFVKVPKFLPNNIANDAMQLTYNTVNLIGPVYQSFLMGGYLVYFGQVSGIGTGTISVTINVSPVPTKLLIAIATPNSYVTGTTRLRFSTTINTSTNSSFTIDSNNTNGAYTYGWFAIGTV